MECASGTPRPQYLIKFPCSSETTSPQLQSGHSKFRLDIHLLGFDASIVLQHIWLKQLKPSQAHKHHKIKLLHLTNLHHEEPGGLGCIFTNLLGSVCCVQVNEAANMAHQFIPFEGQTAPTRCHPQPPTRLSCLCQTSIPASALHPHTKLLSIPMNGIKYNYNYMLHVIVSQLDP